MLYFLYLVYKYIIICIRAQKKWFIQITKGSQGIGTLIIFIALILVAAVGASVLIQTASSLQSKSLDVGRQSQEKITTDIEILQVYATNVSDSEINGGVDPVSVVARLGSGSSAIKISDMLIKFDSSVSSQALTYIMGQNASETTYGVTYILNGSAHIDGYLVEGDMVQFDFYITTGTNISESTYAAIRVIPKNGAIKPVEITTPSAMVDYTIQLYP